mgnify:CR=1 FL=1
MSSNNKPEIDPKQERHTEIGSSMVSIERIAAIIYLYIFVYFISKLSIPWTSMVCATCNSFPRQVTPVWWSYMAHIFLCLFIFPKSNHSSPYDDDVAPDFLEHPPTGLSQPFGVLCLLCLFLFTCLCESTHLWAGRPNLKFTTPPVADINQKAGP